MRPPVVVPFMVIVSSVPPAVSEKGAPPARKRGMQRALHRIGSVRDLDDIVVRGHCDRDPEAIHIARSGRGRERHGDAGSAGEVDNLAEMVERSDRQRGGGDSNLRIRTKPFVASAVPLEFGGSRLEYLSIEGMLTPSLSTSVQPVCVSGGYWNCGG